MSNVGGGQATTAMDLTETESDDGEPKLEIVDDEDSSDSSRRRRHSEEDSLMTSSMAASAENAVRIIRKSLSYDGSVFSLGGGVPSNLRQQRHSHTVEDDSNASEAIESLLLLGRSPVLSPLTKERTTSVSMSPIGRRYSSSSDAFDTRSDPGSNVAHSFTDRFGDKSNGVVSYYQRMRERNNEASKRCRLKRRLKAESTENQANTLLMSNKMLRQRILKLEKIGEIIKDGVRHIQSKPCICPETVAQIKKINLDCPDATNLSNRALIQSSEMYRNQNLDLLLPMAASSEDEMRMDVVSPCPVAAPISFPGRSELSVTPVLLMAPVQSIIKLEPKKEVAFARSITALDVINDTIVKSLASPSPILSSTAYSASLPLNLVKVMGTTNCPLSQPAQPLPCSPLSLERSSKKIFLLSSSRNLSTSCRPSTTSEDDVVIKCEPEIQLMVCEPQETSTNSEEDVDSNIGVDPTSTCIAAVHGSVQCHGENLNLNKLTSCLDLISRERARDSGTSAMERAIIKSRLKIPFWVADELPTFICEKHRYEIVHSVSMFDCAICHKKRTKKLCSPQVTMMTITYRMSLENYATSGNILPIGLLVCSNCREKYLKGVDFSNSQVVSSPEGNKNSCGVSITTVSQGINPDMKKSTVEEGGVTVLKVCNNDELAIGQQQLSPAQHNVQNLKGDQSGDIFAKISRLNEALQAINPRYTPIGFSITSIESCSQLVLEDAVLATEMAVSTLMSVIAHGQENFLWEAIKPKLDAKYGGSKKVPPFNVPEKSDGTKSNANV